MNGDQRRQGFQQPYQYPQYPYVPYPYPPYPYPYPPEEEKEEEPIVIVSGEKKRSMLNTLLLVGIVGVGGYFILKYLGYDPLAILKGIVTQKYNEPLAKEFRITGFDVSSSNIRVNKYETVWQVDVVDKVEVSNAKVYFYVSGVEKTHNVGINVQFGIYNGYWRFKSYHLVPSYVGEEPFFFEGVGRALITVEEGSEGNYYATLDKVEIPVLYKGEHINEINAYVAFRVWADGFESEAYVYKTGVKVETGD